MWSALLCAIADGFAENEKQSSGSTYYHPIAEKYLKDLNDVLASSNPDRLDAWLKEMKEIQIARMKVSCGPALTLFICAPCFINILKRSHIDMISSLYSMDRCVEAGTFTGECKLFLLIPTSHCSTLRSPPCYRRRWSTSGRINSSDDSEPRLACCDIQMLSTASSAPASTSILGLASINQLLSSIN